MIHHSMKNTGIKSLYRRQ